jgi:electron transport complex protein RnfE
MSNENQKVTSTDEFIKGLWRDNPVFVQVLGMCPTSYILIIATFVTVTDYAIQAISVELHKSLGAFISLIVVNCLILSRAEAFASKNSVGRSILDALGMGLGFTFALFCLGAVREILGNGSIFNLAIFPEGYQSWIVMILPAGGFFTLAAWLLVINKVQTKKAKS